jgi:8-oxo-dGTP pyrophosphatase MutT (NUDIX family)
MIDLIEKLKDRLLHPLPGEVAQFKMAPKGRTRQQELPDNIRLGGVMILLFIIDKKWNTILIRRTEDGNHHSGQISFPGGRKDASDQDIIYTACRECEEEIGVPIPDIELVGTLSTLYIPPSNFLVTPSVGYIKTLQNFKASEREVQEIIQLPLDLLFDHRIKKERIVVPSSSPTQQIKTPVYELGDDLIVWGATAMIIAELESIIETIRQTKS